MRELSRLGNLAIGTIQAEVARLREAGLLLERRDRNRLYFRANRQNPLYSGLKSLLLEALELFEFTLEFKSIVLDHLAKKYPPLCPPR